MTSHEFRTAYTKSPKTTRRTTFQDELQAAVSARVSKTKTDQHSYSDDFDEDEDDFFNQLLKSRKKRAAAFKAGKSRTKFTEFELSDDESKQGRTKRVSFLKTPDSCSPSEDTAALDPDDHEPTDSSIGRHGSYNQSFSSQYSSNISENDTQFKEDCVESISPQRRKRSKSLSGQTSDDTPLDLPLPGLSDSSVMESPSPLVPESREKERENIVNEESDIKHESGTEREPPRPKPRQRTLGLNLHVTEKKAEDAGSQDISRPQTSSMSIPLSSDTSKSISSPDRITANSSHLTDGDGADSCSQSASSKSEQLNLLTMSTVGSGSRDGFISDDSKEQERKYSTSFEEVNKSEDQSAAQVNHVHAKSSDTRTLSSQSKSSQRPQSVCSRKVESKYLGTLNVLDHKNLQESQPQAADSLRAAIYQEWLRKKEEKSKESMQLMKKEETLKEKKKKEEDAKKEDAVVSYEAWREKKAESLKVKAKEKQKIMRKEQQAIQEREEKRQSAKQVFEKWKRERDQLLREKYKKQKESERIIKLKKQEEEEERKRDSKSAFSEWCEKKKDVLHKKVTTQRKESQNKEEENQYMQEERDRMALEMYEHWLVRKDLEKKRHKEERHIQEILRDSPPPPWSPPNKTIPFRK
ncbi:LOW QUALITY PROTEIN: uncharacterized protein ACBR49_000660 [Aulostomus maculatus]